MAKDANGVSVEYGDWVRFDVKEGPEVYFIGTVIELVEKRGGVGMLVAFVDDNDKRLKVGKYAADPAKVTVIMRADGALLPPLDAKALKVAGEVG